jgi:hypothetical protein
MKLLITVLAAAWLMSGCFTNPPEEDSTGVGHRDPRPGLCNDATPPCAPPRDWAAPENLALASVRLAREIAE